KDQIDNFLKERRLIRSLEKFVGGRLYEGGLQLLEMTILIYHMMFSALKVEEGEPVDAAGSGATSSAIGAMTSGVG
nr:hypothetical protein [Tanacetum cinerariifolium]